MFGHQHEIRTASAPKSPEFGYPYLLPASVVVFGARKNASYDDQTSQAAAYRLIVALGHLFTCAGHVAGALASLHATVAATKAARRHT